MRKYISTLVLLILLIAAFTGCSNNSNGAATSDSNDTDAKEKISVVATIFPEYDWVREIIGDASEDIELTLLMDSGIDLHSFQPTANDILTISTCDLFIYVGGESDEWVENVLKEVANDDMIVINLLEALGDYAKEEEQVEGMEIDEDEEDGQDEDEIEYDEHVWLSLKNTQMICSAIAQALAQLDEENADSYAANAIAYQEKLAELDSRYEAVCSEAAKKTLLFGDRFPFRYLTDDYGLSYFAAFNGCSAETEASFETIVFLANKVDELGLSCVLTIETSDQKIANTIIQNTEQQNQQVLVLNSMQSITKDDIQNGVTYLTIAEENLLILETALS